MSANAFSTSTPKPRAEGSNPSAPAKDLARNSLEFRAFLVFLGGGMRSTMPLSMACILRFFRIWSYPFLTFPSGTSSINHQKFGAAILLCWPRSKIEPVCYPLQAGRVFLDIVHLGNLRGTVAQEVGYLAGRECHEGSVRLFYAVDQRTAECVSERM